MKLIYKYISIQGCVALLCALSALVCMLYSFDLTSKGLILNIAGVIIAFFYGLPHPPYENVGVRGVEDGTLDKNGHTVGLWRSFGMLQKKLHVASAYIGLLYMFAGFFLV